MVRKNREFRKYYNDLRRTTQRLGGLDVIITTHGIPKASKKASRKAFI